MSKVGEYIHYKLTDYYKFGLGTNATGDKSNYGEMRLRLLNKYTAMTTSSVNTGNLENDLNMLLKYNQHASTSQNADPAVTSAIATFHQQFCNEVRQEFPQMQLDNNLKIINKVTAIGKTGRANAANKSVNWARLRKNIEFLAVTLKKTSNLDPGLAKNIEMAKSLYRELKREMKFIGQDIKTKTGNSRYFINITDKTGPILTKLMHGDKETGFPPLGNLVNAAKNLARVSEAQGYSVEKYLQLAFDGAQNFPKKAGFSELQKFIKGTHTAKNTSLQAISGDLVSTTNFTEDNYTKTILGDGQIMYKMKSTGLEQQQKVDVSGEYEGPDNTKEFVGLNIKSINPYKDGSKTTITLHTGSSLIQLLQEESDFLNHYLNIVPKRDKGPNGTGFFEPQWHSLMKMAIVARTLTGSSIRLDKNNNFDPIANIFVIHNNTNGMFRVFNIGQLIKYISMDIDSLASFKFEGGNPFTGLKNTWVDASSGKSGHQAARARINDLLSQLHRIKFTAYLNAQSMLKLPVLS